MGFWTHQSMTLASNNSSDSLREYTLFNVPFGSTLRRTIVDVGVSDVRVFDVGVGQPPIYPVHWAMDASNDGLTPNLVLAGMATGTEGIHLIAHGQVPVAYHVVNSINAYNADTVTPVAPLHGSITGMPSQSIAMWLSGHDRVDSKAQRAFPGVHPRLCVTIQQATSSFPFDSQAPLTVFSIRQLWDGPGL